MYDLILRDACIIDGSGAPAYRGDVAIEAGRIAALGEIDGPARSNIDLDGLTVAPGFIDIHTHYDAQIMWDAAATPSCYHGVTSVIGGNCGFTLAPITEEAADYLVPMLARVEGMNRATLDAALDITWRSFGEWLDCLEGNLAVNAGFLAGHSALRCLAMGEAAWDTKPTSSQLDTMVALLDESLAHGALGFSSSWGEVHIDHRGHPVPSRASGADELVTLCRALERYPNRVVEFIPTTDAVFGPDVHRVMAEMSAAASSPLNWNLLSVRPGEAERVARTSRLAASDVAKRLGADVYALTLPEPFAMRLSFETGVVLETIPGWAELFRLPAPERVTRLKDRAARAVLSEQANAIGYRAWTDWAGCQISDVASPELRPLVGRRIGDIAAERRCEPFDALIDIALADDLRMGYESALIGDDEDSWAERGRLLRDPRVLIGGSDAGAHLDMMKTFALPTRLLAEVVRRRGLLQLEEAVHALTAVPARMYGLSERGLLRPGYVADLVVFDPDQVDSAPVEMRQDLPANGARLTANAFGIHSVWVNGTAVVRDGALTGARPGAVLRGRTA